MKLSTSIFVAATALLFVPNSRSGPRPRLPEADPVQIGVRLYNSAPVPETEMKAARDVATRTLARAGVGLEWTPCLVTPGAANNVVSPCDISARDSDVILYLVGRREEQKGWGDGLEPGVMGYSLVPIHGEHWLPTIAYVSYPRVQRLSAATSAGLADILGLAIAHEIGHLLLASHDHANQGIMRAHWGLAELQNQAWEQFAFTRDQSRSLRVAVQARLGADADKSAAVRTTPPCRPD